MKLGCMCSLGLFLTLVTSCAADIQREWETAPPYVVPFTFQSEYSFNKPPSEEALDVFNSGAFDGWGLCYIQASDFEKGGTPAELEKEIAFLQTNTGPGKHIWPVMFITKILQFVPGKVHGSWGVSPAMRAQAGIPGMDLDNETGARDVFEHNWRNALLIAKEIGSPGIMFDPEFYFGGIGDIAELAARRSETETVAAAKCQAFGARLADITEEAYPDAVVFWFFTGLHQPEETWDPVPYICLGALKRAKQIGSKQFHVDGGEGGVGYLHRSVDALRARIHNRWIETGELLRQYPNFELGGVLAPYVDIRCHPYWMTFDRIDPHVKTADDFQPWFEALFSNYRYVWLYGASGGTPDTTAFIPWEAKHSAAMSAPIARAKKNARYAPPNLAEPPDEKLPEGAGFDSLNYAQLAREVWVDLAAPANAEIRSQYWRGHSQDPNADTGEGGRLVTEAIEADGRKWTAQIEFDGKKVTKWPWPAISVTSLPKTDISGYTGIAVEVYNPSEKPLYVRFALFTPGTYPNDQWGCINETVPATSSHVFSFTNVTKPITAISFAAVKQPDPVMRIYVSPVFLIRK